MVRKDIIYAWPLGTARATPTPPASYRKGCVNNAIIAVLAPTIAYSCGANLLRELIGREDADEGSVVNPIFTFSVWVEFSKYICRHKFGFDVIELEVVLSESFV